MLSPLTVDDCKHIYLNGRNLLVRNSKDDMLSMVREFDYGHKNNTLTPVNMAINASVSILFIDYSIETKFHFKEVEYIE